MWSIENESQKKTVDGRKVPDANEEYLIYQSIVGVWPAERCELSSISERLQAYAIKAIREAMVHTRWTKPNTAHEEAVCGFIQRILSRQHNSAFLSAAAPFLQKVAYAEHDPWPRPGILLKMVRVRAFRIFIRAPNFGSATSWTPITAVPSTFKLGARALQAFEDSAHFETASIAKDLLKHWSDGRLKLYTIWKALGCRRQHPEVVQRGENLFSLK